MHATYSFALYIHGAEIMDDVLLRTTALSQFTHRYAEKRMDENNGYQELVLITRNNRVLDLTGPGDYRGRDKWFPYVTGEVAAECDGWVWKWAWRLALGCVAVDLHLFNVMDIGLGELKGEGKKASEKIDSLSFAKLMEAIHEEIPRELAIAYTRIVGTKPILFRSVDASKKDENRHDWITEYRRKKRALAYEAFRNSMIPPFTDAEITPYDYRCFDLTWEEAKPNVILQVDIHT